MISPERATSLMQSVVNVLETRTKTANKLEKSCHCPNATDNGSILSFKRYRFFYFQKLVRVVCVE